MPGNQELRDRLERQGSIKVLQESSHQRTRGERRHCWQHLLNEKPSRHKENNTSLEPHTELKHHLGTNYRVLGGNFGSLCAAHQK